MKPGISLLLTQLVDHEVLVYCTGLKVRGVLFKVDKELGVIGISKNGSEVVIDVGTINAIECKGIGDYL